MSVPQSPLLRVPVEIRMLVWSFLFTRKTVHVLEHDRVWCNSAAFAASHNLSECHRHLLQSSVRCSACPRNSVLAIAAVCRSFFTEVVDLRYERTLLCFSSATICLSYLETKLSTHCVTHFGLERIRHVQLDLGPAKYNPREINERNYIILNQLVQRATRLVTLNLNFVWYHRAPLDALALSHGMISCLLQFRGLQSFNLRMYETSPGPLGPSEEHRKLLTRFWMRWWCLEALLRLRVSRCVSTVAHPARPVGLDAAVRDCVGGQRISLEVVRAVMLGLVPDTWSASNLFWADEVARQI